MLNRFEGVDGRRLLIEALETHKLVGGNRELAEQLANVSYLEEVVKDKTIIYQNDPTNDVFLIISGSFSITVNGRELACRGSGDHIGEMGALEPTQKRSATVTATQDSIVLRITEKAFNELGRK